MIDTTDNPLDVLTQSFRYMLENEAYKHLPALLRADFGIEIQGRLKRGYMRSRGKDAPPIEVNILGAGRKDDRPVAIVGESKCNISRKKIDTYLNKVVPLLETGGVEPFVVLVAHMETEPGLKEYARSRGAALYFSYEF